MATKYLTIEDCGRSLSRRRAAGTIGNGHVVINGQAIPFEDFIEILQTYEDWQFSLEIDDGYKLF